MAVQLYVQQTPPPFLSFRVFSSSFFALGNLEREPPYVYPPHGIVVMSSGMAFQKIDIAFGEANV
jgi:hypothetical protein